FEINLDKANELLGKLASLNMTALASAEEQETLKSQDAFWSFSVEKSDNTSDTYSFYKGSEDASDAFLKVSSQPFYAKVNKSTLEDLQKFVKSSLTKTKPV
ncbi:hypothetical protein RZS08_62465, partial [Arthrospira platensis SPKY1]|nr:hypothetical protein [Arthrospira platensis SPKY1]